VTPLASQVAAWVVKIGYDDLPSDVIESTKLRILDVIGLALAGAETAFGRSTIAAAKTLSPTGPSRIFGTGDAVAAPTAAFANAALSQALEYDDTHNESIVHMSSPAVAASLALAGLRTVSGRDLILSITIANEVSCRVGSVSSGQFHRRGFHPTGLFAPFGIAAGIGKILGLDATRLAWAEGTAGSCAAGLLECWVDGTQTKFLHSGFAAQSGLTAALLAESGVSGPPNVFEGRFGLFASHVQDPNVPKNFGRIADDLGTHR
jgi:2-methylcitrate dehydratase PrpD